MFGGGMNGMPGGLFGQLFGGGGGGGFRRGPRKSQSTLYPLK